MKKKILLFARDPGAANCLVPVFLKLKNSKIFIPCLFGKEFALDIFDREKITYTDITKKLKRTSEDDIEIFLRRGGYSCIVTGTTSKDDLTDRYLWRVGRKLGIPTIAILDQWMNYISRFSFHTNENFLIDILPDTICVMDEFAKKEMLKAGFPVDRIEITGQPHFETVIKKQKEITRQEIKKFKNKLDINYGKNVVFASEPLTKDHGVDLGYSQFSIFKEVFLCLEKIAKKENKINMIFKLHPRDDKRSVNKLISGLNKNNNLRIIILEKAAPQLLISSVDLIIGMSSMFLIEGALVNKPIISVQIALDGRAKRKNTFILDKIGYGKTIFKRNELMDEIKNKLKHKVCDKILNFPGNSSEKVIKSIDRLIKYYD